MENWIFSHWADISGYLALALSIALGAFRHYCKTWDKWEKNYLIGLFLTNNPNSRIENFRCLLFKVPLLWRKPNFQSLSLVVVAASSFYAGLALTDNIILFLNPHISADIFRRYFFLCFFALLALRIRISMYIGYEIFSNEKDKTVMQYINSLNRG